MCRRVAQDPTTLEFYLLDLAIRFSAKSARSRFLVHTNYGHLASRVEEPLLCYSVEEQPDATFVISRSPDFRVSGLVERKVLLALDYDLMIQLQIHRPDLLFLHSAALEFDGEAILLPAPAHTGKSTLAWLLERSGFRYLSDELAPIDVTRMEVLPFPRAIALKTVPPPPFQLPKGVVPTGGTIHVPDACLREPSATGPVPLGMLIFPTRLERNMTSRLRKLSSAEAAALLYSNALNPQAHSASGLDIAVEVASRFPCFELEIGDLESADRVIREAMPPGE